MLTVTTITGLRARRSELRIQGRCLGFVPTMGALHEGHLGLVRRARALADEVWASVFVNPAQFGPQEDYAAYPRDLERDRELLEREGVALLFAPSVKEMFPRPMSTTVRVPTLSAGLCGAFRPGHFDGVCLVVAKLFNIITPDVAVFGAKDAQQAAVIRKMTEDLNFPIAIEVAPTVREGDGLAMSSRNAHLDDEQHRVALVLNQALQTAAAAVRSGERCGIALETILAEVVSREPAAALLYVAAVNPETLAPLDVINNRVLFALAVEVGSTRLIDNLCVEVE